MPDFNYSDLLPVGKDQTEYRLVTTEGVSTFQAEGMEFLKVAPAALEKLTSEAIHDINHYLRPDHLHQLENIVKDPEADRKSTRLNSSHIPLSRMPSSA